MNRDFDLARIIPAAGVAAGLSVGLSVAFVRHAESKPHVGPTAAALDEGFSAFFGAVIGLGLGTALCALAVRRGPRVLSGVFAGLIAYALVLAPLVVLTRPSDMSRGEAIGTAAWLILPLGAFAFLGATLGWFSSQLVARARMPHADR